MSAQACTAETSHSRSQVNKETSPSQCGTQSGPGQSAPRLIIGISGKMRAGKDAIASRLTANWGFTALPFAESLKRELQQRMPRTIRAIHDMQAIHAHGCDSGDVAACIREMVYVTKPPGMRELLQEYGTDVRRADDLNYWAKRWRQELPAGDVVVPDVRFPNEARAVLDAGGILWRVERPGTAATASHVSEMGLDDWPWWHAVIRNDNTLESLYRSVDLWAVTLREKSKC